MRAYLLLLLAIAVFAQELDVNAGKALFRQTCGFCHGPDARGASGPDLLRSVLVSHDVDGNLIGPVIRNGRPARGMPAFQLSDRQIRDIAAFLHAEAQKAAFVARRIPLEYPLSKLLVGNAVEGKTYFEKHCTECHSPQRDLAHIASKYTPFDLQARIAFPSGKPPQLTVKDRSGHVFTGEQVYADAFFVSLKDRDGWLHSWPRKEVQVEVHDPLAAHEMLLQRYTDQDIHNLFAYLETLK
jgi:cytochrome c oxidase cbb3-type subunit 3